MGERGPLSMVYISIIITLHLQIHDGPLRAASMYCMVLLQAWLSTSPVSSENLFIINCPRQGLNSDLWDRKPASYQLSHHMQVIFDFLQAAPACYIICLTNTPTPEEFFAAPFLPPISVYNSFAT